MSAHENHFDANLQRGILLFHRGYFNLAAEYFDKAIAAEPNNFLGYFEQANVFYMAGNVRQAMRLLDRAQALAPNEPLIFVRRAWILSSYSLFSRKALRLVNHALQLNPRSIEAFITKSRAYSVGHYWKKSEEAAREALRIDPINDYAANLLAMALRKQGCVSESTETIKKILQRVPEDSFSQANAGWTALQTGNYQQAHAHFLTALSREPKQPLALAGLRETLMQRALPYRLVYQAQAALIGEHILIRLLIIGMVFLIPIIASLLSGSLMVGNIVSFPTILGLILLLPIFLFLTKRLALLFILSHPLISHNITPSERLSAVSGLFFLATCIWLLFLVGTWLPVVFALVLLIYVGWSIRRPERILQEQALKS